MSANLNCCHSCFVHNQNRDQILSIMRKKWSWAKMQNVNPLDMQSHSLTAVWWEERYANIYINS